MKVTRRWLLPVAMGLGVVALLVYAFQPQPVEVDVAAASRGLLRVTVDDDGITRIKERYVVSTPLAGQLLRVNLRPGAAVEAGKTIIASLEPTDPALLDPRARAEAEARVKGAEAGQRRAAAYLETAKLAEKFAQSELGRAQQLLPGKSIARQEFESIEQRSRAASQELRAATFAAQVADFELEQARAALLRTKPPSPGEADRERFAILSPIDGAVLRVFQESATVAPAGTRLLELGDPADIEVVIDVLSTEAVKVSANDKVFIVHWGGGEPLLGRVRLIEPAGFTKISALGVEEQRVNVIVDFVAPLEKRRALGDAYRVEARIVIWEGEDVLRIPSGSLFRQGEGWAVFQVVDGRARLQPVEVGKTNGLETQIMSGLSAGDVVVLHPSDRIKAGTRVAAR